MKGVLFDFWGTLVENGVMPSPVRQVRYIMRLDIPFHDFIVRFEKAFMTKEYEDLNEAFTAVCEEFDVNSEKGLVDQLVGMWNKNEMLCKPYPDTIRVLEDLKNDYKLALVSNTPATIGRVLEKYDLEQYFDAKALSFEEGFLKTDPKLFDKALEELGLEKDEVIMVGDSMETDIKGAEKAGILPLLMDRRNRRDYPNKVESLSEIREFLEGLDE